MPINLRELVTCLFCIAFSISVLTLSKAVSIKWLLLYADCRSSNFPVLFMQLDNCLHTILSIIFDRKDKFKIGWKLLKITSKDIDFISGLRRASFRFLDTTPCWSEVLTILAIISENGPIFCLSMKVGKGSNSQCFAGEDEITEVMSLLETGIKLCILCSISCCDSMYLGLTYLASVNCNCSMMVSILSLKYSENCSAST